MILSLVIFILLEIDWYSTTNPSEEIAFKSRMEKVTFSLSLKHPEAFKNCSQKPRNPFGADTRVHAKGVKILWNFPQFIDLCEYVYGIVHIMH